MGEWSSIIGVAKFGLSLKPGGGFEVSYTYGLYEEIDFYSIARLLQLQEDVYIKERNALNPKPMKITQQTAFLLNIAIIIFLGLSAYTTKIGISLIWDDFAFSWILAIGTSILLFTISKLVIQFIKAGSIFRLIIGYFLVALMSVFFNFNAFYSKQITDVSRQKEKDLIAGEIQKIAGKANRIINSEVEELKLEVDSLLAEKEAEKSNPNRPGPGPIFQKIRRKYDVKSEQLQTLEEKKRKIDYDN